MEKRSTSRVALKGELVADVFACADHCRENQLNEQESVDLTTRYLSSKMDQKITIEIIEAKLRTFGYDWNQVAKIGSGLLRPFRISHWSDAIRNTRNALLQQPFRSSYRTETTSVVSLVEDDSEHAVNREAPRLKRSGRVEDIAPSALPSLPCKRKHQVDDTKLDPLPNIAISSKANPYFASKRSCKGIILDTINAGSRGTSYNPGLLGEEVASVAEIDHLKRMLATQQAEIVRLKQQLTTLKETSSRQLEDEKSRAAHLYNNARENWEHQRRSLEEQYLRQDRSLVEYVERFKSFTGDINLSNDTDIHVPVNKSAEAIGTTWGGIGDDVKRLCFRVRIADEFSAMDFVTQCTEDSPLLFKMCFRSDITSHRIVTSGQKRNILIGTISSAICEKIFGRGTSIFDDRKWAYSDVYWRLLATLGVDIHSIRAMAISIHRESIEYLKREVMPLQAKTMAMKIYEAISPWFASKGKREMVSRMKAIERCLGEAFELLAALELSTKQHRFIVFPPGTPFNDKWMVAENEDGSPVHTSRAGLSKQHVSLCAFPALAEYPEEKLSESNGPNDFEHVLPTSKEFLDGMSALDHSKAIICARAVVLLY